MTPTPEYKTCKYTDIKAWCLANDKKDWLKETARTCDKKFFKLRDKFFSTYAPEKMPVAKPKARNMWDDIEAL